MKKLIFVLMTIGLGVWLFFLFVEKMSSSVFNEVSSNQELILLDTVELLNGEKAIWFCFDIGYSGYTIGEVSIVKNVENLETSSVFKSDYITGISKGNDGKLVIEILSSKEANDFDSGSSLYTLDFSGSHRDTKDNRITAGTQAID